VTDVKIIFTSLVIYRAELAVTLGTSAIIILSSFFFLPSFFLSYFTAELYASQLFSIHFAHQSPLRFSNGSTQF
jgi:hypothetical protein